MLVASGSEQRPGVTQPVDAHVLNHMRTAWPKEAATGWLAVAVGPAMQTLASPATRCWKNATRVPLPPPAA
jgi:hypothetical protein